MAKVRSDMMAAVVALALIVALGPFVVAGLRLQDLGGAASGARDLGVLALNAARHSTVLFGVPPAPVRPPPPAGAPADLAAVPQAAPAALTPPAGRTGGPAPPDGARDSWLPRLLPRPGAPGGQQEPAPAPPPQPPPGAPPRADGAPLLEPVLGLLSPLLPLDHSSAGVPASSPPEPLTAPVVDTLEPVADTVEPVSDTVTDTSEPLLEPVTDGTSDLLGLLH